MSANIELVYLIKKLSKKLSISSDYLALSSILSIIYKNNIKSLNNELKIIYSLKNNFDIVDSLNKLIDINSTDLNLDLKSKYLAIIKRAK